MRIRVGVRVGVLDLRDTPHHRVRVVHNSGAGRVQFCNYPVGKRTIMREIRTMKKTMPTLNMSN